MPLIKRILHHACWYALLGPQTGALCALSLLAIFQGPMSSGILGILPLIIFLAWVNSGLPALLTGVIVAMLPPRIHDYWLYRVVTGAVSGVLCSIAASLIGLAPVTGQYHAANLLTVQAFIYVIIPGLLAGLVLSALITRLPGNPCLAIRIGRVATPGPVVPE